MRMHRDAAYEIDPTGIKGELLDGRAAGLGRGGRARRGARLPQRAGDGAGADRDDQLPDGLRHDRDRARLLAGQVQGAGRRRADDDRQPLGAAGAADARLLRGRRSSRSTPTSTRRARSSARPGSKDEHLPVFDVAVGERAISHTGHIEMMAATQPFISRRDLEDGQPAASRRRSTTSPTPTPRGWKGGLKALAIYRDGSKTAQALRTDAQDEEGAPRPRRSRRPPERKRMPRERESITHKFSIAGHEGYITAGKYEDGSVGEIFLTDIGKEGSTLRGMMNAFATAISIGLQYGVPLEVFVRKFSYMRFEPEGITSNPEIPFAKSMPDYIMRWLASRFIEDTDDARGPRHPDHRRCGPSRRPRQTQLGLGIDRHGRPGQRRQRPLERPRQRRREGEGDRRRGRPRGRGLTDTPPVVPAKMSGLDLGPACEQCGGMMQRTGSCYTCSQLRQQHRLRLSRIPARHTRTTWALVGVVARGLGDARRKGRARARVGRADLVALDQLLEDDRHLELGEGGAEAAADAAAEGDPGVGAGRVVEEALGQEAVRLGVDLGVAVDEVDAGGDRDAGGQLVAADLDRLGQAADHERRSPGAGAASPGSSRSGTRPRRPRPRRAGARASPGGGPGAPSPRRARSRSSRGRRRAG